MKNLNTKHILNKEKEKKIVLSKSKKTIFILIGGLILFLLVGGFFLKNRIYHSEELSCSDDDSSPPPEDQIIGDPRFHRRGKSKFNIFDEVNDRVFYFKSNNSVYCFEGSWGMCGITGVRTKIEGSDPETFEIIDANYAKDKYHVYGKSNIFDKIACTPIEGADPKTFEPLDWPYAKDKNYVYYDLIKILPDADPATFKVLGYGYTKDKNHVWYNNSVRDFDPESFVVLSKYCVKDRNHYYRNGNVVPEDQCHYKNDFGDFYLFFPGKLIATTSKNGGVINLTKTRNLNQLEFEIIPSNRFMLPDDLFRWEKDKDNAERICQETKKCFPGARPNFSYFMDNDIHIEVNNIKGAKFIKTFPERSMSSNYVVEYHFTFFAGNKIFRFWTANNNSTITPSTEEDIISIIKLIHFKRKFLAPLFYSYKNPKVELTISEQPFDYTADLLEARARKCGTEYEPGHFEELVNLFKNTKKIIYRFKYQGESQGEDTYIVTLLPNAARYTNLEDFKKDFYQCAAGGKDYPFMLNKDWLVFISSCGTGFDDGSGRPIGCQEIKNEVEPTLKLIE